MTPLIQIAAFLKRKVKALKYMPRKDLLAWLAWHDLRRSLAWVELEGKILAAGVARPLFNPLLRVDYYAFHEGATLVYADQAASLNPKAFSCLIETMARRFPEATTFMFKHCKTGKLRTWNFKRFLKITTLKGQTMLTARELNLERAG
jgi:hypothetical protein